MERSAVLETSYLIDLERERARGRDGPATSLLRGELAGRGLFLTFTVAGELAAGRSLGDLEVWRTFVGQFRVLPWSFDVSWRYGRLYRYLADNGALIGANDLWIAATALVHDLPLVTANEAHFRRIPDLPLVPYRG